MLTPREMLELGVFGGTYFNNPDWLSEISPEVFQDLDPNLYSLPDSKYSRKQNLFKTRAGQTQQQWEENGWIHPQDPRGWFHWYCRFWSGRRSSDDARQISRWRAIFRHQNSLRSRMHALDLELSDIWTILPRYSRSCQTMLHWGWLAHIEPNGEIPILDM